jgi:hypothetical protein
MSASTSTELSQSYVSNPPEGRVSESVALRRGIASEDWEEKIDETDLEESQPLHAAGNDDAPTPSQEGHRQQSPVIEIDDTVDDELANAFIKELQNMLTCIGAMAAAVERCKITEAIHQDMSDLEMEATLLLSLACANSPEDTSIGARFEASVAKFQELKQVTDGLVIPQKFLRRTLSETVEDSQ